MKEEVPRKFEFTPEGPMRLNSEDQSYLKHLSKHINKFLHLLEDYRVNHGNPHRIAEAYKKICMDAESKNRVERDLARFIMEKFDNFPLKLSVKGHHHTAHSFLQDYLSGKIKDEKMIETGMEGVCSNLGLTIMKLCKTDEIERIYKQK